MRISDWSSDVCSSDLTKAGQIEAIKVERVRDPTKSKRTTVLWFAKDWDYLLVRLQQVETDGKEYNLMLQDGTVNGKAVKGSRSEERSVGKECVSKVRTQ